MSGRVEKLLKAYPEMIQKRDCLAYQLAHFKGLSAEDVIDSMMTPKVDGERVKSSRLSDKTAQIALESVSYTHLDVYKRQDKSQASRTGSPSLEGLLRRRYLVEAGQLP